MKIIELRAENFKRLKAVTIRPDGAMVEVTGANGNGKTSVLDAIWAGLKGRAAGIIEPIRKGAERATIELKLGNGKVAYDVVRTFRRDKHGDVTVDLTVTAGDGTSVRKSPQAVLDSFIGALSFDPLAFARAAPKDQFEVLKAFVPGFDFEANTEKRKQAFDARTDANRAAERARAAAFSVQLPPGPKPKLVDVSGKLDEMQRAASHNASIEANKRNIEDRAAKCDEMLNDVADLRIKADEIEKAAKAMLASLPALRKAIGKPIDVAALRADLGEADRVKGAIAMHEERERHETQAKTFQESSDALTAIIGKLDEQRRDAITAAKMPVDGLALGDGEVLYKGIPFASASHAEKLVASTAVAMAGNPDLRIIRTYDGSLLDKKSLGLIAAMAKSREFQVWVERVDESGKVGFVIADGENGS